MYKNRIACEKSDYGFTYIRELKVEPLWRTLSGRRWLDCEGVSIWEMLKNLVLVRNIEIAGNFILGCCVRKIPINFTSSLKNFNYLNLENDLVAETSVPTKKKTKGGIFNAVLCWVFHNFIRVFLAYYNTIGHKEFYFLEIFSQMISFACVPLRIIINPELWRPFHMFKYSFYKWSVGRTWSHYATSLSQYSRFLKEMIMYLS